MSAATVARWSRTSRSALVAIYRDRKGADADAGARWIDELGTSNRYVLDVWAGG